MSLGRPAARKHIPDYLLLTDTGPVVVDVKPARRLVDPKVAFTFGWTREAVEARGWRCEVATEPPGIELANVRFLAGYRREWLFPPHLLAQLRTWNLDGASLNDAFNWFPNESPQHVRSAVCIFFTGYFQPLEQWLRGFVRIPIDGNEFDARFDEAVDTIYRSSQQQPVAFSHGAAIAMWTMMNVAIPRSTSRSRSPCRTPATSLSGAIRRTARRCSTGMEQSSTS